MLIKLNYHWYAAMANEIECRQVKNTSLLIPLIFFY